MSRGTLGDVRDGSRQPAKGSGQVEGPFKWSDTGRKTVGEIRDGLENSWGGLGGSGDPRVGLKWVGRPFQRFWVGWGTLPEVWDGRGTLSEVQNSRGTFPEVRDGLGDPREGSGRVWGLSGRSGTGRVPSLRFRTGRGGPGQVGGPSERFGTGRGTLGEVQDVSGVTMRFPRRVGGPFGEVRDGSGDPR